MLKVLVSRFLKGFTYKVSIIFDAEVRQENFARANVRCNFKFVRIPSCDLGADARHLGESDGVCLASIQISISISPSYDHLVPEANCCSGNS